MMVSLLPGSFQLNFPSGSQILRAKTLAKQGGRVQGVFWLLSREENYSNRFLFIDKTPVMIYTHIQLFLAEAFDHVVFGFLRDFQPSLV